MQNIEQEIRLAIDRFAVDEARNLLREALKTPTAEIYFLASQVAIDDTQKQRFLQKAIELDPFFAPAIKLLSNHQFENKSRPEREASTSFASEITTAISPTVKHSEINQAFITCTNNAQTTLRRYPYTDAPQRTTIETDKKLVIVERTESGNWFNVLATGSTDQPILGWIPKIEVKDIRLGNKIVNPLDLPITNFQYNSREDVIELITIIGRVSGPTDILWILGFTSIVMSVLMIFLMVAIGSGGGAALFSAWLLLGCVFVILGRNKRKVLTSSIRENIGWNIPLVQVLHRLGHIRRSKQTDNETLMEHQAQMQASEIAGKLLVKVAPEFKDLAALAKQS